MYHRCFIHSCVSGHLGCFHVLAVVNSAIMKIGVHVSFAVLVSSGCMPRSGFAGSYGGFIPSFLRNLCTIFQSGCISLHSHQQFSTPCLALIVCRLSDDGHSDRCEMVSHCAFNLHFSNNGDVEHLFTCLLAICMSSLENFPTFWLDCLFFSNWVVWAACIFWKLILCQLFLLLGCLFTLLVVFFAVQKALSLISSHLFIFVFISITLGGGS